MRAISQDALGGPEVLRLVTTDIPTPGPGEVLVRVAAASVNPADWKVRAGLVTRLGPPPFVLGRDFSGTVTQVGPDVTAFRPGDEVYGFSPARSGAHAEYVTAPVTEVAAKPGTLDHVHAAALPLAGVTAWQPLIRVADVQPGQRVLVHAAAGGIGHLAVQIAKSRGAFVAGTARAANHDLLRKLGADQVIDYTSVAFEQVVGEVDVVLDPISDDYGPRSLDTLRPGGVLIDVRGTGPDRTLVTAAAQARGLRYVPFGYTPSGADLVELAQLVDGGRLRVEIAEVLPLAEAARAHRLVESGHVTGKVVLVP